MLKISSNSLARIVLNPDTNYNESTLSTRSLIRIVAIVLCLVASVSAQNVSGAAHTLLVLPFENESKAPGLEWISEAFPEILGQRLASPITYVISREDRVYAFDRLGIPANLKASRATLYRIAEQMDADFVVFGAYNYDGHTFSTRAQVLDMKKLHLSQEFTSSGPLVNIIEVQSALAWQANKVLNPRSNVSREEFVRNRNTVRLDAFENYVRGIVASTRPEKISRFRQALRIDPQYTQAMLHLGRNYYEGREYDSAASWLSKIPPTDSSAGEANFLLGLSYYYLGQFDKAEAAFKVTESKLPLTEVNNNLGVVTYRRGKREAAEFFQHAVNTDPNDSDYQFNLALALYKNGDHTGATRILRETVAKHPTDVEARQFLDSVYGSGYQVNRAPLPRIKRNYDESSYRQLALEVQNAMEQAMAKADPRTRATYHVERGRQLLSTGMTADAEKEFQEAVLRDPTNADAHLGLALVAEENGNADVARKEARAAVQMKPTADGYLVLARLDLKENNLQSATQNVDQALWLEPSNEAARSLKHKITMQPKTEPQS